MSSKLLKVIYPESTVPVTLLFNLGLSMSEGKVPLDWKLANVTPTVYKPTNKKVETFQKITDPSV